jgi:hypothetical protein
MTSVTDRPLLRAMKSPTITAEQRDVLYGHITTRLTGINDVLLAVEKEDFDAAQQLGREFSDYLDLLCTDLGWGEGSADPIKLSTSQDVLWRVLFRVQERAEAEHQEEEDERAEARQHRHANRVLRETCQQLLSDLSGGPVAEQTPS